MEVALATISQHRSLRLDWVIPRDCDEMATAAIRVAGYDLFAEQENIEVEREDGYGMVLNERVFRELDIPTQHSGYDKRLQKWLTKRKLKLTASSGWGGLMSTPVCELNPIYLPHN